MYKNDVRCAPDKDLESMAAVALPISHAVSCAGQFTHAARAAANAAASADTEGDWQTVQQQTHCRSNVPAEEGMCHAY